MPAVVATVFTMSDTQGAASAKTNKPSNMVKTQPIGVRVLHERIARIDALAGAMASKVGVDVNRSDVVNALILRGLPLLEAEYGIGQAPPPQPEPPAPSPAPTPEKRASKGKATLAAKKGGKGKATRADAGTWLETARAWLAVQTLPVDENGAPYTTAAALMLALGVPAEQHQARGPQAAQVLAALGWVKGRRAVEGGVKVTRYHAPADVAEAAPVEADSVAAEAPTGEAA